MRPVSSKEIANTAIDKSPTQYDGAPEQIAKTPHQDENANLCKNSTTPKIDCSRAASEILETLLRMPKACQILNDMSASRKTSSDLK